MICVAGFYDPGSPFDRHVERFFAENVLSCLSSKYGDIRMRPTWGGNGDSINILVGEKGLQIAFVRNFLAGAKRFRPLGHGIADRSQYRATGPVDGRCMKFCNVAGSDNSKSSYFLGDCILLSFSFALITYVGSGSKTR